MLKYNPFRPGSIVHPGMFAGRLEEIKGLEQALFQTLNGNPTHFLIHGERGIGKSSLLLLLSHYTRGALTSLYDRTYNFLTVSVELEPNDTYAELVRKVARELQRELDRNDKVKKTLKDVWNFITNWEVLGVKYNREAVPPYEMLEELSERLIVISQKLTNEFSGIYVFIDEADKPPVSTNLGEFVKVLTERLSKRGCGNVGLGIVGISTVIRKMRQSHESSVRILAPFELKPLLPKEREEVVTKGLDEANAKNAFAVQMTPEALNVISNISEGYPHFIQQYAYSAFEQDTDNNIDLDDLRKALVKENGALHQLGMRYFEDMYTGEIYSDDYRTVLQVMAQHPNQYITRKEIIEKSGLKPHTVNNALAAMRRKNIIIAQSGKRGSYRLPSRSFAAWILAFKIARKPEDIEPSAAPD